MATGSIVGIVIGVFVVIIIIFIFLFLLYRRQQRKLLFYKHQYFLRTGEYTVSMIPVLHFFPEFKSFCCGQNILHRFVEHYRTTNGGCHCIKGQSLRPPLMIILYIIISNL